VYVGAVRKGYRRPPERYPRRPTPPGARLPSEADIVHKCGVSRVTIGTPSKPGPTNASSKPSTAAEPSSRTAAPNIRTLTEQRQTTELPNRYAD